MIAAEFARFLGIPFTRQANITDILEAVCGVCTDVAIASTEPPPRKKFQRDPAALNGLHAHIDAMLEADPGTRVSKTWQRLADDHGVTVTYPSCST